MGRSSSPLLCAVALAVGVVACGPSPAARLRLPGGASAGLLVGYGGRVIVSHAAGYYLDVLAPGLGPVERRLSWEHAPKDRSVDFGRSIAVSGDGTFIAAGALLPSYLAASGEVRITIWRIDGVPVQELMAPGVLGLGRLQFLADGRLVAHVQVAVPGRPRDWSSALYVWKVRGPDPMPTRWSFPDVGVFYDYEVDGGGRRVALVGSTGPYLAAPGSSRASTPLRAGRTGKAVALHPAGELVAVASAEEEGGAVLVSDAAAPRAIGSTGSGEPDRVTFSPDGRLLALHAVGGRVELFHVESGDRVLATRPAQALAWTPDGAALVTVSADGVVSRWIL